MIELYGRHTRLEDRRCTWYEHEYGDWIFLRRVFSVNPGLAIAGGDWTNYTDCVNIVATKHALVSQYEVSVIFNADDVDPWGDHAERLEAQIKAAVTDDMKISEVKAVVDSILAMEGLI